MREEDKIINYRPDLAKLLNEDLNFAKDFYAKNFQEQYYKVRAILSKSIKDDTGIELFEKLASVADKPYVLDEVFAAHRAELRAYEEYELISDARAFYTICTLSKSTFDKLIEKHNLDELTKMEKYMVESFYKRLMTPMRNPNIEIQPGHVKCYYDQPGNYGCFKRDLESGVEYLSNDCERTIEIFNTPDEEGE